MKIAIEL